MNLIMSIIRLLKAAGKEKKSAEGLFFAVIS